MEISISGGRVGRHTWFNRVWFGAWVLGQTDYAGTQPWMPRLGLWLALPECKRRNSWRWMCLRLRPRGPVYSVRWTLPRWCR
jgi:hypothetical protein